MFHEALRTLQNGPPTKAGPGKDAARSYREAMVAYYRAACWIFDEDHEGEEWSFSWAVAVLNATGQVQYEADWQRRKLREQGLDPFDVRWRLHGQIG